MAMKVRYTVLDGEVVSEVRSGVERDYLPDPLGSTLALLDDTQTKTDTFAYWPNGEVATRTGTTPTPLQYLGTTGYYRDSASRTYVRHRVLDTRSGRWMTQDPLQRGSNRYAYCGNNPVNRTDPSGLAWVQNRFGRWVWIPFRGEPLFAPCPPPSSLPSQGSREPWPGRLPDPRYSGSGGVILEPENISFPVGRGTISVGLVETVRNPGLTSLTFRRSDPIYGTPSVTLPIGRPGGGALGYTGGGLGLRNIRVTMPFPRPQFTEWGVEIPILPQRPSDPEFSLGFGGSEGYLRYPGFTFMWRFFGF